MKSYSVKIRSKQERDAGAIFFPEYTAMPSEMELIAIGVDEKASDMGRTGVILIFKSSPQSHLVRVVTMSAAAFLTIGAAIKGAMERFGDPWTGA